MFFKGGKKKKMVKASLEKLPFSVSASINAMTYKTIHVTGGLNGDLS